MGIEVAPVSLQGNVSSLSKFAEDLKRLPRVVAQRVAAESAEPLTELAKQTFAESEDAYGAAWAPGADGQRVTLDKSGSLKHQLYYVAIGTKLRVALGVPYAKYQIGKRPVFPTQGAPLPEAYSETLARIAVDVCKAEMVR